MTIFAAVLFPLLKLKLCFLHLKDEIVDRDIGKTPEIAKKCSVHPKFVGKSEKSFPRIEAKPRFCKDFETFLPFKTVQITFSSSLEDLSHFFLQI